MQYGKILEGSIMQGTSIGVRPRDLNDLIGKLKQGLPVGAFYPYLSLCFQKISSWTDRVIMTRVTIFVFDLHFGYPIDESSAMTHWYLLCRDISCLDCAAFRIERGRLRLPRCPSPDFPLPNWHPLCVEPSPNGGACYYWLYLPSLQLPPFYGWGIWCLPPHRLLKRRIP